MKKRLTVSLSCACLALALAAVPLPSPAQPPRPATGPQYNDKGELLRPTDYRTWVFVGSNIGLQYTKETPAKPPKEKEKEQYKASSLGNFHNVYINPEAYEHYVKTGKFPDRTVLVMDVYEAKERDEKGVVTKGLFPGEQVAIEVAVKNNKRPDGSKTDWAYYAFPGQQASAKAFADKACYQCHLQHASDDNVWVQFYPTLRMLKKTPAQ
jgi:hypothetical protein